MAIENLDEFIARVNRQATASWGKEYLEHPSTYVWYPETLIYKDIQTNHEVVVLIHSKEIQEIYSKEFACNVWSFDGSRIGFFSGTTSKRPTNNPGTPATASYQRWIVKTDGSFLKSCEGYGHNSVGDNGFGWANTENAYYAFGSNSPEPVTDAELIKSTINSNNVVSSTSILNTYSAANGDSQKFSITSTKKLLIKNCISYDDAYIIVSGGAVKDYGRSISCTAVMRIQLSGPSILQHWGSNRNCFEVGDHKDGVTTYSAWNSGTTYSDGDRVSYGGFNWKSWADNNLNHTPVGGDADDYWVKLTTATTSESGYHGGGPFGLGLTMDYVVYLYEGTHPFFKLKMAGSDAGDGGPVKEDWDGDSYGANEVYPISVPWGHGRYSAPQPAGPCDEYYNHPSIDRWSEYYIMGGYDDYKTTETKPGTVVRKLSDFSNWNAAFDDDGFVDSGVGAQRSRMADGRHHSWTAWSDHVVFFPRDVGSEQDTGHQRMYGSKLNWSNGVDSPYVICYTHLTYTGNNYSALPRPSQSPDGTKVAFATTWTSVNTDKPSIAYAVAYYPYPGKITGITQPGGTSQPIRISFDPGRYTTRTLSGNPVDPKEIKYWHIWVSTDKSTWAELTTTGVAFATRTYDYAAPGAATRYYAITAEEYSRLESRRLGNIWKATLDGSGNLIISEEDTAYPTDPGSISDFWTTNPSPPSNFTVAKQATNRHFLLSWTEPGGSKDRYYNIYYSPTSQPTKDQQYRIASVPVGTTSWLDWNAENDSVAYYAITTVDRLGNESDLLEGESTRIALVFKAA